MCYFYALLLAMQMQSRTSLSFSDLPRGCIEIVTEVNQTCDEVTDEMDDIVDEIFADKLNDEVIASLQLHLNGEPILTVDDFMSEYPHSYAMGLLLGFQIDSSITLKELTLDTLANLLRQKGPMTFDGGYGDEDAEHTILVIGCEKEPQEMIYYLDPNDPAATRQMAFQEFKEKMTDCGLGLLHAPVMTIRPLIDTMRMIPVRRSPLLFSSVLVKRKLSEVDFGSENNGSEAKKPRVEPVALVAPATAASF